MTHNTSEGTTDAYLGTALPITHAAHMEKYKDDLENLGIIYEEIEMGITVPEYMDISSIEDLVGNEDIINGKLIGIDSGAGIMGSAEDAFEQYGLDIELIEGSDAAMTAVLSQAIENKAPIAVTGWKPHWKFTRYDLKILDDPKECFGSGENAYKIVRLGLAEDMPEVTEFLTNMYLDIDQLQEIIYMMEQSDADDMEVCREWLEDNKNTVNSWLPEGYSF